MKIVPYQEKYKRDFIEMNKAWISAMFAMEAEDERELGNIEPYIANGGQIFFALDDTDEVMACCMIAPREDGDWEIMKFAARGMYTGTGAGSACLSACINYAKEKGIDKIIIVSNRKCEQTIHLYRKYGFTEIPVDKKRFPFAEQISHLNSICDFRYLPWANKGAKEQRIERGKTKESENGKAAAVIRLYVITLTAGIVSGCLISNWRT